MERQMFGNSHEGAGVRRVANRVKIRLGGSAGSAPTWDCGRNSQTSTLGTDEKARTYHSRWNFLWSARRGSASRCGRRLPPSNRRPNSSIPRWQSPARRKPIKDAIDVWAQHLPS